ncbi:hypothetical protein [Burkholderia sp. MBR-1]|uniref:hypothetical protein n=1 Tax=Burkholderia sp. MBR-1 TaxID=2732364 RepID=UPI0015EFBFE0|nr:hypothetical protein [Burkholderia sp. MBR-1]QMI49708.1 hypothetical protein MBR110_29965 [Burkholderia sp. MBR-1]
MARPFSKEPTVTDFKRILFMIEGGRALELVKQHIAERQRVHAANRALLQDLGVDEYWSSRDDGTVSRVRFRSTPHPEFTKADKNGSRPKKGTEWARRFAAQKGHVNSSGVIADAFGIPLSVSYGNAGGSKGWRAIGYPLSECGFLWLSTDGPYAMWIPDVEAEVRADRERGYEVGEREAAFRAEFEGCRLIEREEWEILVAQHKLAQKKSATQGANHAE